MSPINERAIARVKEGTVEDYHTSVQLALEASKKWREIPIPQRGEIVRQIGHHLREKLNPLGQLVSLEMGMVF